MAPLGLIVILLGGCGTISRPSFDARTPSLAVDIPPDNVQISSQDRDRLAALVFRFGAATGASSKGGIILALSGGGANGAYGAGVIVGWTASGRRPEFDVVTGISTGALAAPLAFLGPAWDGALERAYLSGQTKRIVNWRNLAALIEPSLFSPGILKNLIDDSVTPELLRQIAVEHAKGRQLLVVTTNLDSESSVIWDMGALASRGNPAALRLFRKILLASASIPGVFPPVMIGGRGIDGAPIAEMHGDGGVTMPFLAVPESLLLWTDPTGKETGRAVYVLVNAQIAPEYSITRGTLPAILARTYDSMNKASLRTTLAANAAFAHRNGLRLFVAAIPAGVDASSFDFDAHAMTALFELGRQRGAAGRAWTAVRPGQDVSEPFAPPPHR
ncbi:MAG: patatin-like phospholipase family protein [Caulobacteraceae bacterium]